MALSDFPVRTSIPVSDISTSADFYERQLRLPLLRTAASADIPEGSRFYESADSLGLAVYQSGFAGRSGATVAIWYVDDIEQVVSDLSSRGVDFVRYDGLDYDSLGITARAGGGRIAWFRDPDGNTFAIESDT